MLRRHAIADGQWECSQDLLPAGRASQADPEHAARLLLVLALAMALAASQGSLAQKAGRRRDLDPHRRRRLSLIQLGPRWLRYLVTPGYFQQLRLDRLYLYPK
jgi:hypothetical protein